jgi:hypothetical protein
MFQKSPLITGNMKVLSVIALGVFALSVITFRNVATLPKLKSTAETPFNWQQFLPQGMISKFGLLLYLLLPIAVDARSKA